MRNSSLPTRHEDVRAARAFADKIGSHELPVEFRGGDELGTQPVPAGKVTEADRKALEAEAWYQDWLKHRTPATPVPRPSAEELQAEEQRLSEALASKGHKLQEWAAQKNREALQREAWYQLLQNRRRW